MNPRLSFWEYWAKYPPYYVRIWAKKRGPYQPVRSDTEIAIASGIPIARIRDISRMTNWNSVTHGEMMNFTAACGFDPSSGRDRAREQQYRIVCAKRNVAPFAYLRRHPKWESEILPRLKLLKQELAIPGIDRPLGLKS